MDDEYIRELTDAEREFIASHGGMIPMLKKALTSAENREDYELCASIKKVIDKMEDTGSDELYIIQDN